MKFFVRSLVIALALTGAVASSYAKPAAAAKPHMSAADDFPIPMCPPGDPDACGWDN
jgi:hypothetical protein